MYARQIYLCVSIYENIPRVYIHSFLFLFCSVSTLRMYVPIQIYFDMHSEHLHSFSSSLPLPPPSVATYNI